MFQYSSFENGQPNSQHGEQLQRNSVKQTSENSHRDSPTEKDGKAGRFTVKYSLVKKQHLHTPTQKRGRPSKNDHSTVIAADVKEKPGPAKRMKTTSMKPKPVSTKPATAKPAPTEPAKSTAEDDPLRVFNTWMMLLTKSRVGPKSPLDILTGYCWQQFWWKTIVGLTSSFERYKATLDCVMEDGKCSQAQEQVLEIFTRDVCAQHLPIATAVWNEYIARL